MNESGYNIDRLEVIFRDLGVSDPASWARSESENGIPQLAIYLFLRLASTPIDSLRTSNEMRDRIRRVGGRDSLEALKRLLDAGASSSDLTEVTRSMLRSYLMEICFLLDDTAAIRFSGWQNSDDLEKVHWGLFRIDSQGKPIAQMAGLHEVAGEVLDSNR